MNKTTGKPLHLTPGFPNEWYAVVYEKGYCFDQYDLVVTEVRQIEHALDTLMKLRISVVEARDEHGVWRIPRPLTRAELRALLDELPCSFGPIGLVLGWQELEEAREQAAFAFEVLEHKGAPPS